MKHLQMGNITSFSQKRSYEGKSNFASFYKSGTFETKSNEKEEKATFVIRSLNCQNSALSHGTVKYFSFNEIKI